MMAFPAVTVVLLPSVAHADGGSIKGVVTETGSGNPIKGAVVVLQSTSLSEEKTTNTTDRGTYVFRDLPPGKYTVQVLYQKADESKVVDLPRDVALTVKFAINPKDAFKRTIRVQTTPVRRDTAAGQTVSMEQIKDVPVGDAVSRDFTAVVDLAPTATRDSAGISLAGTTGAETSYRVEGANVNSPAFGTVSATVIQEFIEEVEIRESGYDAEFGGAAGGQVSARRVSGSNEWRGQTGVRFTPRLAQPRFITGTDESLRVTQVGDFQAQAYAIASGRLIKDKLFMTVGIVPTGSQFSLNQRFYRRVDRDSSGGFEDCPYENGDNDCAPGQDYIQTERFAEQRFKVGGVQFGYLLGLDWAINARHKLRLTFQGGPGMTRTSYRLPFTVDPNAFGTNPASDPLGGASRVATGVINDHFGWDLAHTTLVALGYEGRVADDKLEIDANLSYFQASSIGAWRLDNERWYNTPTTQFNPTTAGGRNLYEFLDADKATNLVPGVDENCNNAAIPGEVCPTRNWLSGGIGEYGTATQRRVEGRFNLTHFFNAAGAHQLKYGGTMEYLRAETLSRYSGSNAGDFYDNCAAGEIDGGEWCYNRSTDQYSFQNDLGRVNNNRYIIVNPDQPNTNITFGYGRVRKEQDDLRALSTPAGEGIRAPRYNETTSTFNYGFYLQDKWAILSNLYLSAGVRWELQDMRDILGRQAVLIWDNVAPRVGIVYDWTDEGKSRLFASYGWFYQPLPLQLNNRVFGGLVTVRRSYRANECAPGTQSSGNDRNVDNQPTEYCVDRASLTTGLTTGAIVPRLRGQYNQQLQVGYEQEIVEDLVVGFRWLHTDLGRAVEDISTDGGTTFLIANPGVSVDQSDITATNNRCDDLRGQLEGLPNGDETAPQIARELQRCLFLSDAYTKVNTLFARPTRNYDAWTLEVRKRFAKNWLLLASYTYSRLVGNYDGFVDPISGAINIGASTQYDLPELVRNSYGPLSFNQPHRAKLDAFYSFNLGEKAGRLVLGTSFRVSSGYPINVRANNNLYAGQFVTQLLPRGSGGRVEPNYQWNLSLSYAYPLPKNLEFEITARVLNITNAKATLRVDEVYTASAARPIAGGDLEDIRHAKIAGQGLFARTLLPPAGNYGVATQFQQPLTAQFEVKLRF
jgi:hypothetical protein